MRQCPRGHFYDPSLSGECPYCNPPENDGPERLTRTSREAEDDPNRTRPIDGMKAGGATGWLLCVEGPDKGAVYELRDGNNYLGRGADMDVCIPGDITISRDKPMVITRDPDSGCFYCAMLGGRSAPRLNGELLLRPSPLKPGDEILLGQTRLLMMTGEERPLDVNRVEETQ